MGAVFCLLLNFLCPLKIFSGGVDGGRQDVGLPGPQNTPRFFSLYLKAPSHAEDIVLYSSKGRKKRPSTMSFIYR
jgi:hypothetical protein